MSKVRSKKMLPKTFGDILDDLMGIGGPRSSSRNKLKISLLENLLLENDHFYEKNYK